MKILILNPTKQIAILKSRKMFKNTNTRKPIASYKNINQNMY